MSSIITYKGFRAEVFFDAEDGLLVGHILDIRDIVGFHAESIPELYDHFHDAVDSAAMIGYNGTINRRLKE